MIWIDWLIVVIPLTTLIALACYSNRYAGSVADFLVAGRIAGRYVLSVGDMTAGLSVIVLVAGCEQHYQTGYAVGFWGSITAPVGVFMAMTGFCMYRWRETRCLSLGQFLELRYGSRFFRMFCAALRTVAEMMSNAIGPAIAANFFIYFLGLPHKVMIWGVALPCYAIVVSLCLLLAIVFIWPGGRISLLITDSMQGLLSYPIFVIIVGYIILNFSWTEDIAPVMWNRVSGQSFMNPYDISQLRDFNIFALLVTLFASILNRGVWIGNDTSGAAKTPHEQKMAGVLGAWRNGFAYVMVLLTAVMVITFMTSSHFLHDRTRFSVSSTDIRQSLSANVLLEVLPNESHRAEILTKVQSLALNPEVNKLAEQPLSQQKNLDTAYFETVRSELGDSPRGRYQFQRFRALYHQMMMPSVLRKIFPTGLAGLFCLLMVMLLISTDDSRIFNASATLMQDVFLPVFKKPLTPKRHLLYLRLCAVAVAFFFLMVSLFFAQLDYINMFTTIMCALWTGGAGPIMLFGLYSKFGNLAGAWSAIILGSGTSLTGLILQRTWAKSVYPLLEQAGFVESIDSLLIIISSPFNPWLDWSMDPIKFPINSYEIYFISMLLSIGGYVIASLLTYRPFDLDRLLHRGSYASGDTVAPEKWSMRSVFRKLIGITPEYTRGDRVIAYAVFGYSIAYSMLLAFVGIVIWNAFDPWPNSWWTVKFFLTSLLIPGIVALISTVWFLWGGIRDLRNLFRDLANRIKDDEDNGQILH